MDTLQIFKINVQIDRLPDGRTLLNVDGLKNDLDIGGEVSQHLLNQLVADVSQRVPQVILAAEESRQFAERIAQQLSIPVFIIDPAALLGGQSLNTLFKNISELQSQGLRQQEPVKAVLYEDLVATGNHALGISRLLLRELINIFHVTCLIQVPRGGQGLLDDEGISLSRLVYWTRRRGFARSLRDDLIDPAVDELVTRPSVAGSQAVGPTTGGSSSEPKPR